VEHGAGGDRTSRQQDPNEGQPATQRTEVRFAYDADALYIGARMYDSLGARGVRTRLTRRDQARRRLAGARLRHLPRPHRPHRLPINPSGVKYDAGQASPYADPSWDPVWQAATRVDSLGWTAELRIPFSQLRFPRDSRADLGDAGVALRGAAERDGHVVVLGEERERRPLALRPPGGLASRRSPARWELIPYALARASYVRPTQPGSPFQDASAYDLRVGADVKALLGSNLTLSPPSTPTSGRWRWTPRW
jgi:hypothetical protein